MALGMTPQQIIDAVERLHRGRGSLAFESKANRDAVYRLAKIRGVSGLPVFKTHEVGALIDDHYVYDLFAADLGLANEKHYRNLYHVTVGND